MQTEFYGAKASAQEAINHLLRLPATGKEQDWEIELADPARIDEMLDALESQTLDLDCQNALALLLLTSMEEASEAGSLDERHVKRMAHILSLRQEVRKKMHFYWIDLDRARNSSLIAKMVSG